MPLSGAVEGLPPPRPAASLGRSTPRTATRGRTWSRGRTAEASKRGGKTMLESWVSASQHAICN
eukprot:14383261-Alexandrium_andersonii.AAC.1